MKRGLVKKVTYLHHYYNIISNKLVKFKELDRECDKYKSKIGKKNMTRMLQTQYSLVE